MSHTADARRRANLDAQRTARCSGGGRTNIEVDDPNAVQPKRRGGHIGTVTCPDCLRGLRGLRATASPRKINEQRDGQTLYFTTYTATIPHHKPGC